MEKQDIPKIKAKLPWGSYKMISLMLDKKYKPGTIEKMFNGARTMRPEVLHAARSLLGTIGNQ
jgi:hypothetical protein